MRWLVCVAFGIVASTGAVALGQPVRGSGAHVEPYRPPVRVDMPDLRTDTLRTDTLRTDTLRTYPTPQVQLPPAVAANPVRSAPQVLNCTEACTSRARECGALENALQGATWQQVKDWMNYWDDNPDNSPDPPCVRGYNQCRWQCR